MYRNGHIDWNISGWIYRCKGRWITRPTSPISPPQTEEFMAQDVRDNPAKSRFELEVSGHLAVAYYQLSPGIITFTHTEVPPALGGQGVGSRLIKGALDQVRARGLKVVVKCPFVAATIGKHKEYGDLIA